MHVFSLGENEAVVVGGDIVVRVVAVQNDSVQIEIKYSVSPQATQEYEDSQVLTEPIRESASP